MRTTCHIALGLWELEDLPSFRTGVLAQLRALVDCELASYNEIGAGPGEVFVVADPAESLNVSGGMLDAFAELALQNPLAAHCARTSETGTLRLSDFISRRKLHALDLYDHVYRHIDTEYQLAFTIPTRGQMIGITLNRARRDFNERELALLQAARALVIPAYRNLHDRARLDAILRASDGEETRPLRRPPGRAERPTAARPRSRRAPPAPALRRSLDDRRATELGRSATPPTTVRVRPVATRHPRARPGGALFYTARQGTSMRSRFARSRAANQRRSARSASPAVRPRYCTSSGRGAQTPRSPSSSASASTPSATTRGHLPTTRRQNHASPLPTLLPGLYQATADDRERRVTSSLPLQFIPGRGACYKPRSCRIIRPPQARTYGNGRAKCMLLTTYPTGVWL